jgi:hypothetical protein
MRDGAQKFTSKTSKEMLKEDRKSQDLSCFERERERNLRGAEKIEQYTTNTKSERKKNRQ